MNDLHGPVINYVLSVKDVTSLMCILPVLRQDQKLTDENDWGNRTCFRQMRVLFPPWPGFLPCRSESAHTDIPLPFAHGCPSVHSERPSLNALRVKHKNTFCKTRPCICNLLRCWSKEEKSYDFVTCRKLCEYFNTSLVVDFVALFINFVNAKKSKLSIGPMLVGPTLDIRDQNLMTKLNFDPVRSDQNGILTYEGWAVRPVWAYCSWSSEPRWIRLQNLDSQQTLGCVGLIRVRWDFCWPNYDPFGFSNCSIRPNFFEDSEFDSAFNVIHRNREFEVKLFK